MTDQAAPLASGSPGGLARLLLQFRARLLERWATRVLDDPRVPHANRLSRPALEDHIPKLIDKLVDRLAQLRVPEQTERLGRVLGAAADVGVAHAHQRSAVHYTLTEALRELSHLRAAVLDLCTEHSVAVSPDEAEFLHVAIDEMMLASAAELERFDKQSYDHALAVVAHDLRNPLNTIVGYASILQGEPPHPDPNKIGEVLGRSSRIMGRLVDDLLTYSKLESGSFSVRTSDVDVAAVVHEALEQFGHAAARRRVELLVSLPKESVHIRGDHDRILQALGNLVGNAIKFTPAKGMVQIELEALPDHCVLRVRDTGPGIAPEHVNEVFRPFWRAPGSSAQGAGLGLAIARAIVEGHGGQIGIESHGPSGASFMVTLPWDAAPATSVKLEADRPEPPR